MDQGPQCFLSGIELIVAQKLLGVLTDRQTHCWGWKLFVISSDFLRHPTNIINLKNEVN